MIKKIICWVALLHATAAIVFWLVGPTLYRVYFGVPQFWLQFDEGRGFSLALYLFLTFMSAVVSGLTLADEL